MDPWSLSVDPIDPSLPYKKSNIRFTCKIYNLFRNYYRDEELREVILHLNCTRPYVLRAGESWASPNARPRRAQGFLARELAGRANAIDVRQGRTSKKPVDANWVRPRLRCDAIFGARLVISPRKRHPLQPSLDRINPAGAHDQDNTRCVALAVILGMHAFENSQQVLLQLFSVVLKPKLQPKASGGAAMGGSGN